jgi:hypothetical protein
MKTNLREVMKQFKKAVILLAAQEVLSNASEKKAKHGRMPVALAHACNTRSSKQWIKSMS